MLSPPTVFLRQSRHPAGSREARVGRSGDSARERRVVVLLATSGASCAVKVCREKRRARRQWRELTHADGGHQHCICLIASFPPHRKFALKTPDYMGNRTADRRFKLKTNLIKWNYQSNLILVTKHYMGDLTQGLTVHSIRPISVAGVTGLTTGFGFDRSALKVETVGLIRALFTRARCALM